MHRTTMKIKNIFSAILMAMLVMTAPLTLTSCDGEDQLDTNQFSESLSLLSFGPSPVARGGELRFIGTGLNNVKSISLEGCEDITDITRKSNREISIIVPKNAQPGYVVLHAAKKDLVSKTQLTFTEPVGFAETASLNPNSIKPGQVLTIKGTYLNLVESVIFAEGVAVDEFETSSATDPMNMTIKVVVPEEAQTGKLFLGFVATGDTMMNRVLSNEILTVTLPSVKEIANLSGKKPGDKIELEGADLDLVTNVTVANEEVEFEVADDKISFVLPASTPDAAEIAMYPASGIKVTIATIGMTVPSELVATPATELRIGNEVVISGNDLDVVETVTFPGLTTVTEFTFAEGKIKVNCPEGFTSGDVVLTCKSGIEVKVAIATQKPVFESFEATAVSMGNDVTINGQNLDLVSKVIYAGDKEGSVKEGGSDTQIVVTMPASGVESGKITLVMANGETAETEELTVNKPEFAYALDPAVLLSYAENEIHAGSIVSFEADNIDKLTGITIDGQECQVIIKESTIYVLTPDNAKLKSVIKLISSNGEIEYTIALLPNSEIVTTLWKGASELGWSGAGQVYLGDDGGASLIEAGAKAGDILRIKLAPTADDWAAQIWEGHWGVQYDEIKAENYDLAGNDYYYNITLTDDLIKTFTTAGGWGGIVLVQGQSMIVTALELLQKVSMEQTIWEGSETMDWDKNQAYIGEDGGQQFIDAEVKPGTKVHFYLTVSDPSAWRIQIFEGHWGPQYADFSGDGNEGSTQWDLAGNDGKVTIELTQAMIDAALTKGWWGGLFVVQGQFCTVTKMTVE